ncbi:MAG: dehydrogenase [Gemmatimonadetes bacterium]|nr:dehydrogenase [Gemmatimonadota bacterium]
MCRIHDPSHSPSSGNWGCSMNVTDRQFKVALTGDFFEEDGAGKFRDMGLSVLEAYPRIDHFALSEFRNPIGAEQLDETQGVIVLTPAVTAETVSRAQNLLAIVRFGVGYDTVDVGACTEADVGVFITSGAVDRSVAEATVGWMIGLTHHILVKDRLVRSGKWDDRTRYMGGELRDRTFGAVGLGGIARETIRLLGGFGMNDPIAFDPFVESKVASDLGVRLVDLDELLSTADFVSIHCPLNDDTKGLIGATELALMSQNAFLINTARGGIVEESALKSALESGSIAGAALDCFEQEPVLDANPLGELENVLLAPHSIAWTDELFRDIGRRACAIMIDLAEGKAPSGCVNPNVFDRRGFQKKWARFKI